MRILVTGAAGYIGSALVGALAGRDVLATDQSEPAGVLGNLAYPQFARSLITPQVGAVFHLASLVSGGARIGPGAIPLTRMLSAASSSASISVSAITPALAT